MADTPRLIERAFPLRQASLDSLHEKNMRHGHISTLHIWPARRPLAASRAALITTLLPDPGTPERRAAIVDRMGGRVVTRIEKKQVGGREITVEREETAGGILHWGREHDNDLDWFRAQIRAAFPGRHPRVLDPFAGGGAIPLEAMRLGCETTAIDINPVAWLLLRCTLDFPQRLAGERRPFPLFARRNREFMTAFLESEGLAGISLRTQLETLGFDADAEPQLDGLASNSISLDAPLSWHVRAWGQWVLDAARAEIGGLYPAVDGKAPLAYLWARTITCKNCRASIPLIRTAWLCRKERKRVRLQWSPNAARTRVDFTIEQEVPRARGNGAQRREDDKRLGQGTMSRSGVSCPCCDAITSRDDYQYQAQNGQMGAVLLAVVYEQPKPRSRGFTKEYRRPVAEDMQVFARLEGLRQKLDQDLPFGLPREPISAERPSPNARGMSGLTRFGIKTHDAMYSPRQLVALGTFAKCTRAAVDLAASEGYPDLWCDALRAYLYCSLARLADRVSTLCTWQVSAQQVNHVFARYALTMTSDYAESAPFADASGGYLQGVEWVSEIVDHLTAALVAAPAPTIVHGSAGEYSNGLFDLIITDPPYYDAVPYSDVMDYFYVWARRVVGDRWPETFAAPLAPRDEEYIQHAGRLGGDNERARDLYETNMERAFRRAAEMLAEDGRFVIVFAHKDPTAWGTLVAASIRAGFTVDASWPIQTERSSRLLALSSAALSSSVWLVCKKRPAAARPGWDNRVLDEMRANIYIRLREYWDAGIRGPDFVWAATGPALEAYSKHPVVKKANEPGKVMEVDEFLRAVRRIVVDFVVGRVLSRGEGLEVTGLDDVTTYYLLHRHDFGLGDAPIGPCILYAVSCGLSDSALESNHDLLARTGGAARAIDASDDSDDDDSSDSDEPEEDVGGTGSMVKLKAWHQRKRPSMGYDAAIDSARARRGRDQPALGLELEGEAPRARLVPMIDQVHRLMHLWKAGDQSAVDEYLDSRALRKNEIFLRLLQALIELAPGGSEERSMLESLSNHIGRLMLAVPQLEVELS